MFRASAPPAILMLCLLTSGMLRGQDPGSAAGSMETRESDELSAEMVGLKKKVRRSLAYYFQRPENNVERSPWAVMHCVIGYGVDTPLLVDGQNVNAIAWLCSNAPCYSMRLLYASGSDGLALRMGPGYQGHEGQFLSILAQSRVKIDYPLLVDGRRLAIRDLVQHEKQTCRSGTELTFKLIGLAHYLDSDETWRTARGEDWSVSRLIREELAQPIIGACCGGTHRLMGFSYAVRSREREGKPIDGQWARAKQYLQDYHQYTFRLLNSDGSFSTSWFENASSYGDAERRLNTSGHVLEWLVYSLPQEQLADEPVVRAVNYLADLLWEERHRRWEIGPRGHAIHALALYDERMFGGEPGRRAEQLADLAHPALTVAENDLVDRQDAADSSEVSDGNRRGLFRRRVR